MEQRDEEWSERRRADDEWNEWIAEHMRIVEQRDESVRALVALRAAWRNARPAVPNWVAGDLDELFAGVLANMSDEDLAEIFFDERETGGGRHDL